MSPLDLPHRASRAIAKIVNKNLSGQFDLRKMISAEFEAVFTILQKQEMLEIFFFLIIIVVAQITTLIFIELKEIYCYPS